MALTEDDAGLVRELRELLSRHGADWVAEEVDAERSPVHGAQGEATLEPDATLEAEALLVAISRSLGAIPEMLLDASETLRAFPQDADGVLLGNNEISFAETDPELRLMVEDAASLAAPIEHLLSESADDE
jgi:hypothetical protein